ncbi:MAG TPA: bifunctional 4-hydroxy-2-oxoglutarate aldolase/2-dehydro-3-deoxy-phosphogluconate aldolase [Solirubrobacter sp.]|nr:bifunctional 4-hydroxy-2-oxoglutarate aldolase/2-dehydro-3-deoxy-phosphogluconate aldolase [Solirubrobacter sp.]
MIERLQELRVVPVVTLPDVESAVPLARALTAGGLPVAEITFRSEAAAAGIEAIRNAAPEVLVGAGTVLDVETVDRAVAAGAQFIVSPGLNEAVVGRARQLGVPIIPGAVTPTEVERALSLGLTLLKFFPAEAAGGLKYLDALAAPYRGVRFMPTGGITPRNLATYLERPHVVACGGTWIATADDLRAGRFDRITANAQGATMTAVQDPPIYEPTPGSAMRGKVALVTGGASGIGEAVARSFAANEGRVLLVDTDEERLNWVVESINNPNARGFVGDVCDEATVEAAFAQAVNDWGRIDVLVNSAGRDSLSPPVTEVTLDEWNKTIGPNLTAVFLCCREAFRVMERQSGGGRIINMGSSSARVASGPGHSPYRASKHGMMGFSKNILLEGIEKNIGVTVINPSHVKTPMTEIIDKGLYDGDQPAYLDGWLDEKELREGIHASCIDVGNVAELTLYVATRTPDVTIPSLALYPTHKAHRYGMEV